MSGILNNLTRVMDTIVTQEGRSQLAAGKMQISYVSFTDATTFYQADVASGSTDASSRIFLEHCNLPQDQITFQTDEGGQLEAFLNSDGTQLKDGRIISYSFNALTASVLTGSNQSSRFLQGNEFLDSAETLMLSSVDNFTKLRLLSTHDDIFDDDGFDVGNKNIEFVITQNRPIRNADQHTANINQLENLFNDPRLSRVANFQYLPPINKTEHVDVNKADFHQLASRQLGTYLPWGRTQLGGLTGRHIEGELAYFDRQGFSKTIIFDPTSKNNQLVAQFFEVNFDTITKLDVIEYGKYVLGRGQPTSCFFVGKVMKNSHGVQTFVHLFTLLFG